MVITYGAGDRDARALVMTLDRRGGGLGVVGFGDPLLLLCHRLDEMFACSAYADDA